jgi:hypothetical protein
VTGTAFMMGRGRTQHPNPQFYYQPGSGPLFDMGPYYLTIWLTCSDRSTASWRWRQRGQEERLITADGPTRTPHSKFSPTNIPVAARVPLRRHRQLRRLLGRLQARPIDQLHGTEGSLRLPDPAFSGTVSAPRGADWAISPARLSHGAQLALCRFGRANYHCSASPILRALTSGESRAPRATSPCMCWKSEAIWLRENAAQLPSMEPSTSRRCSAGRGGKPAGLAGGFVP